MLLKDGYEYTVAWKKTVYELNPSFYSQLVTLQDEFAKLDGPEKFKVKDIFLPHVLSKMEPETT